ncbi:MAG: hypothetical protein BGP04_05680 [Rhizobiales bacterium 62-17]|nr:hypothetical protein [Hyphomicrobiales bacterium]OJY02803.1 MAG: hypothetical protein BGP04_05680 [Rhizobiales bacterium 62-17]
MFDPDDIDWLALSAPAEEPRFDVVFLLHDRFYIGDPNDGAEIADPSRYVPIASPGTDSVLSVTDVAGREQELALHYRRIIEMAAKHRRPFSQIRHYFWMRLILRWRSGETSLPWYDHWLSMTPLLDWLDSAGNGQHWYDVDQGWEMLVRRRSTHFFVREGDGDGQEALNIQVEREPLLRSIAPLRQQTTAAIAMLTEHLGADVWSAYLYQPNVRFGTKDWSPHAKPKKIDRLK